MVIKTLSRSIREYKLQSALTPLFMVGEVVLECFIPLIMAHLIDSIEAKAMTPVVRFGVILLGMAAVSLLCGTLSGRFAARAATGFARNLRRDLFYKVQDLSFGNIDKFSSAGLVTRLTTDVTDRKSVV